jgi:hypothetical protein
MVDNAEGASSNPQQMMVHMIQQRTAALRQEFNAALRSAQATQSRGLQVPGQHPPQKINPAEASHVWMCGKIAALEVALQMQDQAIAGLAERIEQLKGQ